MGTRAVGCALRRRLGPGGRRSAAGRRGRLHRAPAPVAHQGVEPILSQLATAAVAGLPPAGPEVRRGRLPITLRGKPGVTVRAPRCVEEQGFTLHANTCAGAELRPPIANEHVQEGPEGLVRNVLKRH